MRNWKKRIARLSSLAIAATLTAGALTNEAKSAPKISWETSLATAQKKAKAARKPILVDFYTTWCGPCKLMDKNTYSNAAVVTESKKWVMLKLDGDKNSALVRKYKVEGYPTTLFLKPNGQTVGGFVGYANANEMLKQMRAAAPKAR